jgi:hypothetical protein
VNHFARPGELRGCAVGEVLRGGTDREELVGCCQGGAHGALSGRSLGPAPMGRSLGVALSRRWLGRLRFNSRLGL